MDTALAIVGILVGLLDLGIALWLVGKLMEAQRQGEKQETANTLATERQALKFERLESIMQDVRLKVHEAEKSHANDAYEGTGFYSPVKDRVTGKTEYKKVQELGPIKPGESIDDLLARAEDYANGKVPSA